MDIDTTWTDYPTCPWCGCVDQDWWDGTELRNDGDEETVSCPSCDRSYTTTICIDTTFTTEKRRDTLSKELARLQRHLSSIEESEEPLSKHRQWETNSLRSRIAALVRERDDLKKNGEWDEDDPTE